MLLFSLFYFLLEFEAQLTINNKYTPILFEIISFIIGDYYFTLIRKLDIFNFYHLRTSSLVIIPLWVSYVSNKWSLQYHKILMYQKQVTWII
jgi:DMSO reductase anchor subunit